MNNNRPLRILTWHVHGSYLFYLAQSPHEFYLPVKPDKPEGYGGRSGSFPWPANVHDVPVEEVPSLDFDLILFQSHRNYLEDQHEILSEAQRNRPRIYLEHNPPRQHPTETRHPVDDPETLIVHVTAFNELMWDNGSSPTRVIEHGVTVPEDVRYTGELERGIVVVNGLPKRGRRLGLDIFEHARETIPLDLVGMQSAEIGGLGAVDHHQLPALEARYRFFFNPIRYTSMGLAVCEAMMLGMPVIGLATTEMVTVVENGVSGYIDTRLDRLVDNMRNLLQNPAEARRLGENARRLAEERYGIGRFVADWNDTFSEVIDHEGDALIANR